MLFLTNAAQSFWQALTGKKKWTKQDFIAGVILLFCFVAIKRIIGF